MSRFNEERAFIKLPCGGVARFDVDSGISWRCEYCMAVVGSIGQPSDCKEEAAKWDRWKALGGEGWDYSIKHDDEEAPYPDGELRED